jgi:hypothetical protein
VPLRNGAWPHISFYATKDGKISVSFQGWDASKTVLDGQQFAMGRRGREVHRGQAHMALRLGAIPAPEWRGVRTLIWLLRKVSLLRNWMSLLRNRLTDQADVEADS